MLTALRQASCNAKLCTPPRPMRLSGSHLCTLFYLALIGFFYLRYKPPPSPLKGMSNQQTRILGYRCSCLPMQSNTGPNSPPHDQKLGTATLDGHLGTALRCTTRLDWHALAMLLPLALLQRQMKLRQMKPRQGALITEPPWHCKMCFYGHQPCNSQITKSQSCQGYL